MRPGEESRDVKDAAKMTERGRRAAGGEDDTARKEEDTARETDGSPRTQQKAITHASVKEILSDAKCGDLIKVSWQLRHERGEWSGRLGRVSQRSKVWSVVYDLGETELDTFIPNPDVVYYQVEVCHKKKAAEEPAATARKTQPAAKEAAKGSSTTGKSATQANAPAVAERSVKPAAPVTPATGVPPAVAGKKKTPAKTPAAKKAQKEPKNSPAQEISDDAAWEEIGPMMDDLLAEQAKAGVNANQEEVFRLRCEKGPFAAVVKGRFLKDLERRRGVVTVVSELALLTRHHPIPPLMRRFFD